jgi:hypothetical protein
MFPHGVVILVMAPHGLVTLVMAEFSRRCTQSSLQPTVWPGRGGCASVWNKNRCSSQNIVHTTACTVHQHIYCIPQHVLYTTTYSVDLNKHYSPQNTLCTKTELYTATYTLPHSRYCTVHHNTYCTYLATYIVHHNTYCTPQNKLYLKTHIGLDSK